MRERHGHAPTGKPSREYRAWQAMKSRCLGRGKGSKTYPAKGIKVCERWQNSFKAFFTDMGFCPEGCQLERKENAKGYSPDNCVWATGKQNCRNKDNNRKLTFEGKTLTVTEWAEVLRVPAPTLYSRLYAGKSVAEILRA